MATPPYRKLKCPECGNTKYFTEVALRPTDQSVTCGPDTEPDFDSFDYDEVLVVSLVCASDRCVEKGVVVWSNPDIRQEVEAYLKRVLPESSGATKKTCLPKQKQTTYSAGSAACRT